MATTEQETSLKSPTANPAEHRGMPQAAETVTDVLNDSQRPAKRPKHSQHSQPAYGPLPLTETTLQTLEDTYGPLELGLPHFISLCAYLSVLLCWGWHIRPSDMVAFLAQYKLFRATMPGDRTAFVPSNQPITPSYHLWFFTQPRGQFRAEVITANHLRQLWRANHYHFLRCELSLKQIIRRNSSWIAKSPTTPDRAADSPDRSMTDAFSTADGSHISEAQQGPKRKRLDIV